jgi:defect-in-organelle-trafficking protein DotC
MKRNIQLFIAALCYLMLSACTHQTTLSSVDTTNLSQLENISVPPRPSPATTTQELSGLRLKALKETAMSLGAQGGLAWASERMNSQLSKDSKQLDGVFNFNVMILDHGVIPPVLEQGDNTLNLADPNTIRVADRTYKIISQARFATTPPNWRDYLWLTYNKPTLPDKTLLPKSDEEQAVWRHGITDGWQKGIEQSYSIFQQNLARLKRDYRGMILYRKLLEERIISPPFVSRTTLGVTGDGSNMNINDQVLRIVALPSLQTNSEKWNAVVIKKHD